MSQYLHPAPPAAYQGVVRTMGGRSVAATPHPARLHSLKGNGGLRYRGMGNMNWDAAAQTAIATGSQATQAAVSGADSAQLIMSTPAMIGGVATAAVSGATWAAVAIPVIGAAVVGVTLWLSMWYRRGKQKEAATKVVDEIEPKLRENRDGYLSGPRYRSSQIQALNNFDAMWQAVVQACSNPQLGSAGQRCITDRDRNGCTWKEDGQCWNWFVGYRDTIANDPQVRPDPVQTATGSWVDPETGEVLQASALDTMMSGNTGLILAGGLVAVALLMGGSK